MIGIAKRRKVGSQRTPQAKPVERIKSFLTDGEGAVLDELLTVEEAADRLAITRARVNQLVTEGTLKPYPINRRCYLLSEKQVARYAASDRNPGRKAARF